MDFNPDEFLKDEPSSAPKESGFNPDAFLAPPPKEGPGILSKLKNAYDAVSPSAIYEKEHPGKHVVGGTPLDNWAIGLSAPGPVAAEALSKAAAPIVNPVARFIGERFATNPLPAKIASMAKVPEGGSMLGKLVTEPVRAIGDTAKLAKGAQSTVTKLLDNPEKLGKFGSILKGAAARGGNALATADFLLQQRDPEYQKLKKDMGE